MKQRVKKILVLAGTVAAAGGIGIALFGVRHDEEAQSGAGRAAAPVEKRGSQRLDAITSRSATSPALAQVKALHPERVTPLVAPAPFDRAEFEADPAAYLGRVEPGRCYQTKKDPGPESVHLQAVSSLTQPVGDGAVALSVRTAPAAPVTFTAFGAGHFTENALNSVSVRADSNGFAVAHYLVAAGSTASVPVLVGSPEAVGNQTFFIGPERAD